MYDSTSLVPKLMHVAEKLELTDFCLLPVSSYSKPTSAMESESVTASNYAFIPDEAHEFYEIAIVLDGSVVFAAEGEYYKFFENQICVIDKGAIHANGWLKTEYENASILWINIIGMNLRIHTTSYSTGRTYGAGMDIIGVDEFLIDEILRELRTKSIGYETAILSYMKSFLTLIYRKLASNATKSGSLWDQLIVHEAEQYIVEHLDSRLSLQEISKNVAISPNYLSLLFKQVNGRNILDYAHEIKINKAKSLLSSNLTLSEIAQRLGFYDQFHFSKIFKKYTQISPSQYRKSMIENLQPFTPKS